MKLVIVESPTKAKTIARFLGKEYEIVSSYGHVRDLPKSALGVDVGHNFEPRYVVPAKSRKTIAKLKKSAQTADEVVLATDEDREGEAIAWHISQALGLGSKSQIANGKSSNDKRLAISDKPIKRIVFHEITKSAIESALQNPRGIDSNLVDAQQARRVLDRLVGYKLSPLLWKKVMRGLSAGRVQSVALRLVVEREREREAFVPQEYWTLEALLETTEKKEFKAKLWKKNGRIVKDLDLGSKKEIEEILTALKNAAWSIGKIEKKETRRNPLPPYTTSTLQQDAARRLRFSAKQTMMLAQQLYEGVELEGGREGLITYMRTDSVSLSSEARAAAERLIKEKFGERYARPTQYRTKQKTAQEAHEAIRPTDPGRLGETLKPYLNPRQLKLYILIWERFVASQMAPAIFDATALVIETLTEYLFRATGTTQKFDGFLKVWRQKAQEVILPDVKEGERLTLKKLLNERHETQPPSRYSEASLVKALEEYGIGRPSTYAPIMSTIVERGYVEKDTERRFSPTEIGLIVNDLLVEHFPKIVDLKFTARLEEELDEIAEGKKEWVGVIRAFYEPFAEKLAQKESEIKKSEVKKDTPTDKTCPVCGKALVIKLGRFGKFYACTGFPDCKHTENFTEKIDLQCPTCGQGEVVIRRTKKGKLFYGCSRYPACDYASWRNPKQATREGIEKGSSKN